jgi:hypothetical protein
VTVFQENSCLHDAISDPAAIQQVSLSHALEATTP